MDERQKYTAFSIPRRETLPAKETLPHVQADAANALPLTGEAFAEIEYEFSLGNAAAGEKERRSFTLVPASQLIGKRTTEPIRQKFYDMRALASGNPFAKNDSQLFYSQARFMEDFTDDYDGNALFSMYYPYYQHMGYEQLRTYFTWRTKTRRGEISPTSLSYVFLYIYKLLSGVGVESPADGLDKLLAIWNSFSGREPALDKYLPRWLGDYHIYYDLPHSLEDFIEEHSLKGYYPELFLSGAGAKNSLTLWNGISGYDVTKSRFYKDGNEALLNDCFYTVLCNIQQLCAKQNSRFEDLLICHVSKGATWRPFEGALFYHWLKQSDRQVEIPGGGVFYCKNNRWTADIAIHFSGRRELVGYLIKKTEACLRQAVKYRYSIKAERNMLPNEVRRKLKEADIPFMALKKVIEKAVADFYSGLKPVIKVEVNHVNLARIRDEALGTQIKLIVTEDEAAVIPAEVPAERGSLPPLEQVSAPASHALDSWASLKEALSGVEQEALLIALGGGTDIKAFADENGVMLEVLADGINEKAMDRIGDNILELDDGMVVYDEYMGKIKGMVEWE